MQNPIKIKEINQKMCYMYIKTRNRAKTVVNMGTRVYIVLRENKTRTIITEKGMEMSLNTVTTRRCVG